MLKDEDLPIYLETKLETASLAQKSAERFKPSQRAMERSMLSISLRDKIRKTEIRRRMKVKHITGRAVELKYVL